jgi:hypothetical protein
VDEAIGVRVRVLGELDPDWASWFVGFAVEPRPDGTTDLVGRVRDQAALHGLLGAIRDVGLAIVSLETAGVSSKEAARG